MWFLRPESDRLGWFLSDSSVRSNLDWSRFTSIKIPKPSIEIQQKIIDVFSLAQKAKELATEAENQIKAICPALMQYITHN
jgi:type I restriction enzyme S subunit